MRLLMQLKQKILDEQLPTGYAALSDALKVKVATIVWNAVQTIQR